MEEEKPLIGSTPKSTGLCGPTGAIYRYTVLLVVSLICFGSYFAYDEIQPLEEPMMLALGYTNVTGEHNKFGILYSVYSFPNIILVFFGGLLGDKIGLRAAGFIFVILVWIGSVLVALGPQLATMKLLAPHNAYILTAAGRTVFGSGSESLNVIQTSMVSRWFAGGRELAFAMGLVLSMSRLGDFLALALAANLAVWFGSFKYALWAGTVLCTLSFLSVIIYSLLDKRAEKFYPNRTENAEENAINFKAVLHFDPRFWLVSIVCMCYYGGIFPFVAVASDFLEKQYGYHSTKAGYYSSIITLSSMVLSPLLGKFLDVVGRRPYFVALGSIAVIPAHIALAFNMPYPIIPIIVIGLSFSIVPSALWPSIPIITKEKELATAFGTMAAIQNTGLTIINYAAGQIADYKYRYVMLFFVLMDSIGLLFAIVLIIVDRAKGGQLSSVAGKKAPMTHISEETPPPINYES